MNSSTLALTLALLLSLTFSVVPNVAAAEAESKTKTKAKAKSSQASETKVTATGKEKSKAKSKPKEKEAASPVSDDVAELQKAETLLKELTTAKKANFKKLLNSGKKEDLTKLPGIGEGTSDAIIKARPFESPAQLILVKGIGESTFAKVVKSLK